MTLLRIVLVGPLGHASKDSLCIGVRRRGHRACLWRLFLAGQKPSFLFTMKLPEEVVLFGISIGLRKGLSADSPVSSENHRGKHLPLGAVTHVRRRAAHTLGGLSAQLSSGVGNTQLLTDIRGH